MDSNTKPAWITALAQPQHSTPASTQHTTTTPASAPVHTASAGIAPFTPTQHPPLTAPSCELPTATPELTSDEHIEALPAYAPPPALKLATSHQGIDVLSAVKQSPMPTIEPPIDPAANPHDVVNKPWLGKLSVTELIAFNTHCKMVLDAGGTVHAATLLRLRAYESPYVGLIVTPALAEEHVKVCKRLGVDVGGWKDAQDIVYAKAREMLNKAMTQTVRDEYRVLYNQERAAAHKAWKDAIQEREQVLEELNEKVEFARERHREYRNKTFDEWLVEKQS